MLDTEPLEPHEGVPGLMQCKLCGGVTQDRGVVAHHLPGCPWRISQEIATRSGSEDAPDPYHPTDAAAEVGGSGAPTPCPDCAAAPGEPHTDGCDVARCVLCGWQRIGCDHDGDPDGAGSTWTGRWPGADECERLGLWCLDRLNEGLGWVPCPPDTPGATHDLHALAIAAARGQVVWDRDTQQWIAPPAPA